MLHMYILAHLMREEGRIELRQGRLLGFSLSNYRQRINIPKATFYRAVLVLIDGGFIVKQKRGFYAISDSYRRSCNRVKPADKVYSV